MYRRDSAIILFSVIYFCNILSVAVFSVIMFLFLFL